jgi:hypothetical protein
MPTRKTLPAWIPTAIRRLRDFIIGRWFAAVLTAALSAIVALVGFSLRPAPSRGLVNLSAPSVVVLSQSPGLSLKVSMVITAGQPIPQPGRLADVAAGQREAQRRGYGFDILLQPAGAISKPVTLYLVLADFPTLTPPFSSEQLYPRPVVPHEGVQYVSPPLVGPAQPGRKDYLIPVVLDTRNVLFPGSPPDTGIAVSSLGRIGSASEGPQLQIEFPSYPETTPGGTGEPAQAVPTASVFAQVSFPRYLPAQLYVPDLYPGTSIFNSDYADLRDFQFLAGDPPSAIDYGTQGGWRWIGIGQVGALAQSVAGVSAQQSRLFWSGIALGVAGAGAVTALVALVDPIQSALRGNTAESGSGQPGSASGEATAEDGAKESGEAPATGGPEVTTPQEGAAPAGEAEPDDGEPDSD